MKQVSLITLILKKPKCLIDIIKYCFDIIYNSSLNNELKSYELRQIHSTIIGMEKLLASNHYYNSNIWKDFRQKKEMIFDCLQNIIKEYFPIQIKIGGFNKQFREFTSSGYYPYERTFQIQLSSKKITIIGWPIKGGKVVSQLFSLRNSIEKYANIRHKYADKNDNDFYMVIGELNDEFYGFGKYSEELKVEISTIEQKVRDYLSINPCEFIITEKDLYFAQYEHVTLPLNSTNFFNLKNEAISPDFIKKLYSDK
jgi:hypothetical protein